MSWLEDALNDQEGRELVEAIHERKAAEEPPAVVEWDTIKAVPLQRVADLEEREQTAREREAAAMWDQLPPFMRGHQLKALPEDPDEPGGDGYSHGNLDPEDIGEADVICSSHEEAPDLDMIHRPVLDIDFPAALIPSTTPGHFHLYLDKPMGSIKYFKLLEALAEAGIIQAGYAGVSKARGYTSVRLPWVAKATPTTEEPNE